MYGGCVSLFLLGSSFGCFIQINNNLTCDEGEVWQKVSFMEKAIFFFLIDKQDKSLQSIQMGNDFDSCYYGDSFYVLVDHA